MGGGKFEIKTRTDGFINTDLVLIELQKELSEVEKKIKKANGNRILNERTLNLIKYKGSIKNAISRIKNRTFGICKECEEKIPIERLKIVPCTRFCFKCKEERNENNKNRNFYLMTGRAYAS